MIKCNACAWRKAKETHWSIASAGVTNYLSIRKEVLIKTSALVHFNIPTCIKGDIHNMHLCVSELYVQTWIKHLRKPDLQIQLYCTNLLCKTRILFYCARRIRMQLVCQFKCESASPTRAAQNWTTRFWSQSGGCCWYSTGQMWPRFTPVGFKHMLQCFVESFLS